MPIRPLPLPGFLAPILPALIFLLVLQTPHAAWVMIPKPAGMPQFGIIVVGPGANLYSFRYGTVWHSADRGASFQKSPMSITYTGTDTEILFTPQHKLLIATETKGVLEFAPPFASHASLNRGLGWDSTAIFQDMQYDDQDNLYMTARQPVTPDVNLYVLKASYAGIRNSALRKPVLSSPQSFELNGRRLPPKARARIMRAERSGF